LDAEADDDGVFATEPAQVLELTDELQLEQ
jgi:hypothetical protein